MTSRRGGAFPSAAAAFWAALLLLLFALPAPARGLPVPRLESADCPFALPKDGSVTYARLVVPETRPYIHGGRTVALPVLVLKCRSKDPRPDPVLYLEGGPGGPSVAYYEDWLGSPILDRRDLVLFDQRGVGESEPSLACPEVRTARLEAETKSADPEEARRILVASAASCAARLRGAGIDLSSYNTAESARDLADLRRLMGLSQWNLYGISYGTRLALRLLHEDPGGVRSAVLDSVVDPAADEFASASKNAEAAFERLFAAVSADPAAARAFPGLRVRMEKAAARLDAAPVPARIRFPDGRNGTVPVRGSDLLDTVYGFLYEAGSIPYIPLLVEAVEKGDVSHLAMAREEWFYDDLADGLYYALQGHDEAPFSRMPESEDPYDPLRLERDMALAFRSGTADGAANAALSPDVPALVLAGGFDPVTPPEGSRRVAERLPKAVFLHFPGLGHGASVSPGPEKLVAAFFEDPGAKLSGEGLRESRAPRFVTRLHVTSAPYRLVTRVAYDRDTDVTAAILAFAGIFLAGAVSVRHTWRDRRRPGASRWGVAARMAGGAAATLDGAFMAVLPMAVYAANAKDPSMLFFGLPAGFELLSWLPRSALPGALALVLGLPFVLRDRGISSRARIFFAVLALAEVLFPVVLAGEKLL